jgi:hypothetical protein
MKIKNISLYSLMILCATATFTNCKPNNSNSEELITTVILTAADPLSSGLPSVLKFTDKDGDGGNAPIITSDSLKANTTYNISVQLLNESTTPTINITDEVKEEALEHQLFYQLSNSNIGTVSYKPDDIDSKGKPLGLNPILVTGAAGNNGSLTVILKHEPNKEASGISISNAAAAGGSTDLEVSLPIYIK